MLCFWLSGFFSSDAGRRVIIIIIMESATAFQVASYLSLILVLALRGTKWLNCLIIIDLLTLAGWLSAAAPQPECMTLFFGNFQKYMRVGDQKHVILLEWPNLRNRDEDSPTTCTRMQKPCMEVVEW